VVANLLVVPMLHPTPVPKNSARWDLSKLLTLTGCIVRSARFSSDA
jgi:hypothetical protein